VEADPGLVGQDGDPLGPQHRRELAEHAWQAPGRHHRHTLDDNLAPMPQPPGRLLTPAWDGLDRMANFEYRVGAMRIVKLAWVGEVEA
jgi:hypothetical protein